MDKAVDIKALFGKLERAVNEEDVENIFDDITEAKAKKRCQCKVLQSFYSPGYYRLSIEEQYQHKRAIFLTGKWKLINDMPSSTGRSHESGFI